MIGDMSHSEIVRCLYNDTEIPLNGSVWLDNQRISSLAKTTKCISALYALSPHFEGTVRIFWSIGDNFCFRLEVPLDELAAGDDGTDLWVITTAVKLFAMSGSDEVEIPISSEVQFINFYSTLEIIPDDLYVAAVAAIREVA